MTYFGQLCKSVDNFFSGHLEPYRVALSRECIWQHDSTPYHTSRIKSHGSHTISATSLPPTYGRTIPHTANALIVMHGVHLTVRRTKLIVAPKINWKQGLWQYSPTETRITSRRIAGDPEVVWRPWFNPMAVFLINLIFSISRNFCVTLVNISLFGNLDNNLPIATCTRSNCLLR